ncbi:MAG: hypothetical protein AB1716_22930 [Planctomycetota bacterium]
MFELDETRRDALVEGWAQRIVARGFGPLAVFALEAHKPLAGIGAQAVLAFGPLVSALTAAPAEELAAFLHSPDNVERLIVRIEQLNAERAAARTAERKRRAEVHRRARRWRRLRREGGSAG